MNKPENPNAFPELHYPNLEEISNRGMTLRDYFASNIIGHLYLGAKEFPNIGRSNIVAEAYKYADAMLLERQKEDGG